MPAQLQPVKSFTLLAAFHAFNFSSPIYPLTCAKRCHPGFKSSCIEQDIGNVYETWQRNTQAPYETSCWDSAFCLPLQKTQRLYGEVSRTPWNFSQWWSGREMKESLPASAFPQTPMCTKNISPAHVDLQSPSFTLYSFFMRWSTVRGRNLHIWKRIWILNPKQPQGCS